MAIEIMKRYENKYMINGSTYLKLQDRISQFMELDEYNVQSGMYTIANLYYDTDSNHLIRTSIAKPKYKEKLSMSLNKEEAQCILDETKETFIWLKTLIQ